MGTSSLRERVEHLLNQVSDLDAKELSLLAGLSSSHVGQFKRGKVESIHSDTAEALARVTGATRSWLAFGEGKAPSKRVVQATIAAARALRDAAAPVEPDTRDSHPAVV